MTPATPLDGRVALVTGAGRGLGRALARGLAAAGAAVVASARTRSEIDALAAALQRDGHAAHAVTADVRRRADVETLLHEVAQRFQRLDILVNNAGVFQICAIEDTDEALWDAILDTNLKAPYLVTRAALPLLRRSAGHVVNIGSVASRRAFPGSGAYCASKFGLLGLTEVLREELRDAGVRVTCVLPGAIDTPIWDAIGGGPARAGMMRPKHVAQAVVDACCLPPGTCMEELVLQPGPLSKPAPEE